MALCENCLKCTHNEPLINGLCKECYEWKQKYEDYWENPIDWINQEEE